MKTLFKWIGDQQGIATSLIEATLVVAIASILTSVALVTATDQTEDANFNAAQAEIKLIGLSVLSFIQDDGFPPAFQLGSQRSSTDEVFMVLESGGADPDDPHAEWKLGSHDLLDNHLVHDSPGGVSADDAAIRYPKAGAVTDSRGETVDRRRGWNGPYMSQIPRADPWGDKYFVNVGLLTPRGLELAEALFGFPQGVRPAVFVISAGPNRSIDTRIAQATDSFAVGGDDLVFRIQ